MSKEKQNHNEVQDLVSEQAIEKMKELVKHNNICLFTTNLSSAPLQTRPMSTQEVDDEGNLWFMSSEESDKNFEVNQDDRVQLFFANKGDAEFLSVYGRATILRDRNKVEDIWTPIAKAWFQGGKDDPNLTLIKVKPEDVYYWDTKNGKMVSLLKIAASVVVGRTMDDGIEGKLNVL